MQVLCSSKQIVSSGRASFPFIQLYNQDPFSLFSALQFVLLYQSSGIQCPFLFSGMVAALGNLYIVCSICVFALMLCDYVKAVIYCRHSHWKFCKRQKETACCFFTFKPCFFHVKIKNSNLLQMTVWCAFSPNTSSLTPQGVGDEVCVGGRGVAGGDSLNTNVSTWHGWKTEGGLSRLAL